MSLRRSFFVRNAAFVSAVVPLVLAAGCSQTPPLSLSFSAAPQGTCATRSQDWLTGRVRCVYATVCGVNNGPCAEVALRGTAANDRTFPTEILVSLETGATEFAIAVRPVPGVTRYDINLIAYGESASSTNPMIARGRASGVELAPGAINILLSPVQDPRVTTSAGASSCPGGEGSAIIRRAFHQAVALPNGEVLLLGGIESGAALGGSARLLTGPNLVQVFTPGPDTLSTVTVEGSDTEFSRALFEARWIGSESEGERIRLFGGVSGAGSVTFNTNTLSVAPADGAPTAPVVDVLYNPTTRTIRVANTISMVVTTAVESPVDIAPQIARPQPTQGVSALASMGGRFTVIGMPSVDVLSSVRRGGTLSRLGTGWLVYGGNTADPAGTRTAARLSLLDATGAPIMTAFPEELTNSAHHTATAVDFTPNTRGDETLVFVGGMPIGDEEVPFPLVADAVPSPIRGVQLAGAAVTSLTSANDPVVERIFHTATLVDVDSTSGRILVAGGSTVTTIRLQATTSVLEVEVGRSGTLAQRPLHPLRFARFGHTATYLPTTDRVLITGGLTNAATALVFVEEPELIYVGSTEGTVCGAEAIDAGTPDARMSLPDAGFTSDAFGPDAFGPDAR